MAQEIHNGPVQFNFDLTMGGLTGDQLFDAIIASKKSRIALDKIGLVSIDGETAGASYTFGDLLSYELGGHNT